jgi:Secretion system C-terminal sorting domain
MKFFFALLFSCAAMISFAQPFTYTTDFGTATSGAPPSPFVTGVTSPNVVTVGGWTGGNIFFGGVTGGAYCKNTSNGNGSMVLTLTVPAGQDLSITGIQWQARRTSTGPTVFTLDVNGTSFTVSGTNTTSFSLFTATGSALDLTGTVTITLTASGATGSSQNFRLDDFQVSAAVLPVSLKNFKVTEIKKANQISFTTASERNNSHFEIERSADGQAFRNIGEVKGAGNSNDEKNYTFTDEKPLAGTNYYRLKQVDLDGQFEYSKVVTARFGREGSLSVIPTLVVDNLQVSLDETSTENGTWEIIDLSGRQVLAGTIEAEQDAFQADLSSLQEGSYIVRVQMGATVLTERVMKL